MKQFNEKMIRSISLAFYEVACKDDTVDCFKLVEQAWINHQWYKEDTWALINYLETKGYIKVLRMPNDIWAWKVGHFDIGTLYQ